MRATIPIFAGILFAAASLVHCGSPAHAEQPKATCSCDAPVVRSGSRLKARVLKSEDGFSVQLGTDAWDAQLNTPCSWVDLGNTNQPARGRCAPIAFTPDTTHFADESCAHSVGVAFAGDTVPKFCFEANAYSVAGAPVTIIYAKNGAGGACVATSDSFSQSPGAMFYACDGAATDARSFAEMTSGYGD